MSAGGQCPPAERKYNTKAPSATCPHGDEFRPATRDDVLYTRRPPGNSVLCPYRRKHPTNGMAPMQSNPDAIPTCSQVERIETAYNGAVPGQLDLMSDREVDRQLSQLYFDAQGPSMLERIQNPQLGQTQADVVQEALESLADYTENAGLQTALLWRYAEIHQTWKTHKNPDMRTSDAWLGNMDQNAIVRVNIGIGKSTDTARRGSLRIIERAWGQDWFNKLRPENKPRCDSATAAPKRLLFQIAANCKRGCTLEEVEAGWARARAQRLDPDWRRRNPGAPRSKHIVNSDIASLNVREEGTEGRRTVEAFFPDLEEDRLELKALQATQTVPATQLQPAQQEASKRTSTKRRRVAARQQPPDTDADSTGETEHDNRGGLRECGGATIRKALATIHRTLDDGDICRMCSPIVAELETDEIYEWVSRLEDITVHTTRQT